MITPPITSTLHQAPPNERVPTKTLGQQDFMKLLLTSLQTQNPLKPQDAGAMLGQMSQIGMIQSMTNMQQDIARSRVEQQVTLGQSLINKTVRLADSNNADITGIVTEVQQNNGKVELRVNGQNYSITGLKAVLQ